MSRIPDERVRSEKGKKRWSVFICAVLSMAVLSVLFTPGGVAPFSWGETRASEGDPANDYGAMAGSGPKGEIYVAYWAEAVSGPSFALAVDPDGIYPEGGPVFTTHTIINEMGMGTLVTWPYWSAALAVAPNGDVYAAWSDNRDSATKGTDIRVAVSTNSGSAFRPSVIVSDFGGVNAEGYPSIAVAPNGDVWVTWADDRRGGGNYDIMVSRSTDGGATWGANIVVNEMTTVMRWFPKLAIDSAGSVYVAWSDWGGGTVRAYCDFSRDNGATWNGNFELGALGTKTGLPDVGVDAHDVVHAAWQDYDNGGVYYSHSFDRGLTWSVPIRLDNGRDYGDPSPRIALSDDGRAFVTWEDRVGGMPYARYVQSWDWGLEWNDEYSPTSIQSAIPTVAVDHDNNVIWAWSKDDGAPDNMEAYMLFWDEAPRMVKNIVATHLAAPGSVRISWSPNTERDMAAYQIALISGQMYWIVLDSIPSTQTSYDLTGLANGEYSYAILAVDIAGQNSEPAFVSFTVGPTVQDAIDDLQNRLNELNTSMHDAITGMQGDIQELQDQNADLHGQLTKVSDDLASAQNLNMMLMIVVIVLLIITMILAARRPKIKAPEPAPAPAAQPPSPQQYQQPPPPQYPPQQPPPYAPP